MNGRSVPFFSITSFSSAVSSFMVVVFFCCAHAENVIVENISVAINEVIIIVFMLSFLLYNDYLICKIIYFYIYL